VITHLEGQNGIKRKFIVVRQNLDALEIDFSNMLIEDTNNGGMSYDECEFDLYPLNSPQDNVFTEFLSADMMWLHRLIQASVRHLILLWRNKKLNRVIDGQWLFYHHSWEFQLEKDSLVIVLPNTAGLVSLLYATYLLIDYCNAKYYTIFMDIFGRLIWNSFISLVPTSP
jgi:hypothetical protein